jgi:hypothetical protein
VTCEEWKARRKSHTESGTPRTENLWHGMLIPYPYIIIFHVIKSKLQSLETSRSDDQNRTKMIKVNTYIYIYIYIYIKQPVESEHHVAASDSEKN